MRLFYLLPSILKSLWGETSSPTWEAQGQRKPAPHLLLLNILPPPNTGGGDGDTRHWEGVRYGRRRAVGPSQAQSVQAACLIRRMHL